MHLDAHVFPSRDGRVLFSQSELPHHFVHHFSLTCHVCLCFGPEHSLALHGLSYEVFSTAAEIAGVEGSEVNLLLVLLFLPLRQIAGQQILIKLDHSTF